MRRQFATLDVFTDRRFAGNPLAVVLEAEGLAAAAMQAIAREFGHPETVFVLTPGDRSHRARLRIFTPARDCRSAIRPSGPRCCSDCATGRPPTALQARKTSVRCVARPAGPAGRSARFVIPQLPAQVGEASTMVIAGRCGSSRPRSASGDLARRAGRPASRLPWCRSRA